MLGSLHVWAQPDRHCNHVLYGVVTDSETLEPLPYARIVVEGTENGTLSGMNGEFRLEALCDGELHLDVSHIGCEPLHLAVTIKENTHLDITLPHSHSHVDSVLIEHKHSDPKPMVSQSELSGRNLDQMRGKSLGEALLKITGVNALQTGPSIFKPMIHGMHSNRILILNNGIRQEGQQWGTEHGPEIDPFIATKLTVLKGASGVRFGPDAMGGVVIVEPAELPDSTGIGGAVHLVGMSNGWGGATSGHLEGNFGKIPALSWRLQGTYRRLGDQHAPTYNLSNTGLRERNYSGALGWKKKKYGAEAYYSIFNTDIGILAAAHIGNLTDLETAIGRDTPLLVRPFTYTIDRPRQEVLHELTKGMVWFNPGEHATLKLTVARQFNQRKEYDITRRSITTPGLHYAVTTHLGELMFEHGKWKGFKGQVGLSGQVQKNTYRGAFLIPDYRSHTAGAFLIERFIRLRWELEAGLRYDTRFLRVYLYPPSGVVTQERTWANSSLTLGAIYRFSAHVNANLNIGTAWRPPAVNELYSAGLHHGAAAVEFGDSTLHQERALNAILGLRYQGHERLSGEITLYHNQINGYIYLQPVFPPTLTVRGAFPTFAYRQTDATLSGADASFAWMPFHGFKWESKASILRARNQSTGEYLIWMPSDRFENTFSYTFGDRKSVKDPSLGISLMNVRHQNRAVPGQDYLAPPPAYFLLGAEAKGQILLGKLPLDIQFSVTNLLNSRYRDYLDRFRYFADAPGRSFVLRMSYPFHFHTSRKKS
jgi:iron complex outermembrane receptor protein